MHLQWYMYNHEGRTNGVFITIRILLSWIRKLRQKVHTTWCRQSHLKDQNPMYEENWVLNLKIHFQKISKLPSNFHRSNHFSSLLLHNMQVSIERQLFNSINNPITLCLQSSLHVHKITGDEGKTGQFSAQGEMKTPWQADTCTLFAESVIKIF